jgi:hypothetical protein
MRLIGTIASLAKKWGIARAEMRKEAPQPVERSKKRRRRTLGEKFLVAVQILFPTLDHRNRLKLLKTKKKEEALMRARGKVRLDEQFEASVISAYEAKAKKVRAGVGKNYLIHPLTPSKNGRDRWIEATRDELIRRHGDTVNTIRSNEFKNLHGWAESMAETFYDEDPDCCYSPSDAVDEEFSCA